MKAARRFHAALLAVIGLAVGLSGCSISDLSFRQDHRLQILTPADRSDVSLPFDVSWELRNPQPAEVQFAVPVSYTHLRAHETVLDLVCRLLLEKKKQNTTAIQK